MDCLIPLFSLHSPNNCPRHRSHHHTYQALLPPLMFPWHLIFFPALQLTVTCLLLSTMLSSLNPKDIGLRTFGSHKPYFPCQIKALSKVILVQAMVKDSVATATNDVFAKKQL